VRRDLRLSDISGNDAPILEISAGKDVSISFRRFLTGTSLQTGPKKK
jgi:hypothetical protein